MPSRRRLLRICATGLPLGVAGCLGTGGESPDETARTTGTETTDSGTETMSDPGTETSPGPETTAVGPPPEVREVEPDAVADRGVPTGPNVESTAEQPFLAFAVGDRDDVANPDDNLPHLVWVWNDTDDSQEVGVAVTTGGTTLLDERYEFPARAALGFELREPRPYEFTVRASDREETVGVERSRFDCNDSATDVIVEPDEIREFSITTDLACSTATASETS
ncbi:hypothetical protein [Halorussus salinisoli]|uniref:hypothetical protein n=1 Tax=Halorussus salinisoli TaxID=2558242 RepID=UPI0010C1A1C0|nr:hypothetical protein [Halorussus salinisoli]